MMLQDSDAPALFSIPNLLYTMENSNAVRLAAASGFKVPAAIGGTAINPSIATG
jgi:hypothetical protein